MRVLCNVWLVMLVVFTAIASGCADNRGLVKISGVVTVDGQQPTMAGSIFFIPDQEAGAGEARQATARFNNDGKFTASTWEKGDGLKPGKYRVRIECWEAAPSINGSNGVSLIDRKHVNWANSDGMLRLEVVSGKRNNDIIFDVSAASEAVIQAERAAHQRTEANAQTRIDNISMP